MRTTIDLDEDVLNAVRSLAGASGRSLGVVLSELARRALTAPAGLDKGPGGFPTFEVPAGAVLLTVETVRAALDDDT